jgi:hypothetical protein
MWTGSTTLKNWLQWCASIGRTKLTSSQSEKHSLRSAPFCADKSGTFCEVVVTALGAARRFRGLALLALLFACAAASSGPDPRRALLPTALVPVGTTTPAPSVEKRISIAWEYPGGMPQNGLAFDVVCSTNLTSDPAKWERVAECTASPFVTNCALPVAFYRIRSKRV